MTPDGPRARAVLAQRGSASVLVIGLLCALLMATAAVVSVCALFAVKQHVVAAADAAALAAADAASGRVAGVPCDRADRAARLNEAILFSCTIDGDVATVGVRSRAAGVPITVMARAGPPGTP